MNDSDIGGSDTHIDQVTGDIVCITLVDPQAEKQANSGTGRQANSSSRHPNISPYYDN